MFKYYALLALLATSVIASPIPAGSGAKNVAARDAYGGAVPNPWFNGHASGGDPSAAKRARPRPQAARRRYAIQARAQRGHAARRDDDGRDDEEWSEDREDGEKGNGDNDKDDDDKEAPKGDQSKGDQSKGDHSKGEHSKGDQSKGDQSKGDQSGDKKDDSSKGDDGSQGGKSGGGGGSSGGSTTAEATYYNLDDPEQNEGYEPGTVACGDQKYSDSDMIVAVGTDKFAGGALCGKKVKITDTSNGNTAEATIVDQCGSCKGDKANNLDLSPSLWAQLHNQDTSKGASNAGVFPIEYTIMD